jgi:aminotransferase EvaB
MSRLAQAQIECGVHYPVPIHVMPGFRTSVCGPGSLPQTERAAGEILSLPLFPGLAKSSVERVIAVLNDAVET